MVLPVGTDLKTTLHAKLVEVRTALLATLDGLGEHDLRRPLVPSGTNLLGLVKHLTGIEHVYLVESFGRPAPDVLPWVADGSVWDNGDMWATADESSAELLALYDRAVEASDATVATLDLDAPARVPHWPAERTDTTLAVLLVRMVAETAQHAGHAEIVRELIDGRTGIDPDEPRYTAEARDAAERFRLPT
jgi:hypothetical protein